MRPKRFLIAHAKPGSSATGLDLSGKVKPEDRPAFYAQIDIGLAPFPAISLENYYEMLWFGIPFVSLADDRAGSRLGLAVLGDIGLGALCAETEKGYVDKCIMLASDLKALASIRENMRERIPGQSRLPRPGHCSRIRGSLSRHVAKLVPWQSVTLGPACQDTSGSYRKLVRI